MLPLLDHRNACLLEYSSDRERAQEHLRIASTQLDKFKDRHAAAVNQLLCIVTYTTKPGPNVYENFTKISVPRIG